MTLDRSSILRTGELFTIDVDAEIRKLGDKRLKSDGESALELVQFASNLKPKQIDIELDKQRLCIHAAGGTFDEKTADVLMTVMNPNADAVNRHNAVVTLEDLGGLALLGAFVLPKYKVTLEWTSGKNAMGLRFVEGVSTTRYTPQTPVDFRMEIKSPRKNLKAEIALIQTRCRFAKVPITLDGRQVSSGPSLNNCLLEREVKNRSLTGLVGVPLKGDLVNLVTLTNGIVSSQTVLAFPSGLALDAILEKKDPNSRRQAQILENWGKELYTELGLKYEDFNEVNKRRIRELLFEYCLQTRDQSHISNARVFVQAVGPELNLDGLLALVEQKQIYAIDEEESIDDYDPAGACVLKLGELDRRFVETFLVAAPPSPPTRIRRNGFKLKYETRMRQFISQLFRHFPKLPGRQIPREELDDNELSFLLALRHHLEKAHPLSNIHMTSGQGNLVIKSNNSDGEKTYYISRSHPKLQHMVRAYSTNNSYISPSLKLLIT